MGLINAISEGLSALNPFNKEASIDAPRREPDFMQMTEQERSMRSSAELRIALKRAEEGGFSDIRTDKDRNSMTKEDLLIAMSDAKESFEKRQAELAAQQPDAGPSTPNGPASLARAGIDLNTGSWAPTAPGR